MLEILYRLAVNDVYLRSARVPGNCLRLFSLTFEKEWRPKPLDLGVDCQFALGSGHIRDHDFADQSVISPEREMPRRPLVGHHVAEMVIEDVDNLIVPDFAGTSPACYC